MKTCRYQIIFWRDIPVLVRVKEGRKRHTYQLNNRFQDTVYRAAFRGKVYGRWDYAEAWEPTAWTESDGTPDEIGARLCARLDAEYDERRLDRLARNVGYNPGEEVQGNDHE